MDLKNACVEVCDSRSMHVWWIALWWSWSTILFIDCLPYEWRSGTSDGLFLPIYPPRSMHVVIWFLMTSKFLQQVYEFFWLMLSPWIIRTLTLPSLLASSVPCIALSHLESWCKLRRCIQNPVIRYALSHINLLISSSKQPPYLPIMEFP